MSGFDKYLDRIQIFLSLLQKPVKHPTTHFLLIISLLTKSTYSNDIAAFPYRIAIECVLIEEFLRLCPSRRGDHLSLHVTSKVQKMKVHKTILNAYVQPSNGAQCPVGRLRIDVQRNNRMGWLATSVTRF